MGKKIKFVSRKQSTAKKDVANAVRSRRGRSAPANKATTPLPKKPPKKKKGRPVVIVKSKIDKMEAVFSYGGTDEEAMFYADVKMSTFYDYCRAHPDFSERKELLKKNIILAARKKIGKKILDENDKEADIPALSKWLLERKLPEEFAPTNKIDESATINTISGLFGAAIEDDERQENDTGTTEDKT
jgi:hypothetical protein